MSAIIARRFAEGVSGLKRDISLYSRELRHIFKILPAAANESARNQLLDRACYLQMGIRDMYEYVAHAKKYNSIPLPHANVVFLPVQDEETWNSNYTWLIDSYVKTSFDD
jgi:hypothetical protein